MAITDSLIQLPQPTSVSGFNAGTSQMTDGLGNVIQLAKGVLQDPVTASTAGGQSRIASGYLYSRSYDDGGYQEISLRYISSPLVTVVNASDVFTIQAGTKPVKIAMLRVSGTVQVGSPAGVEYVIVSVIKRSTLDSGGTSSTLSPVLHNITTDSLYTAGQLPSVKSYTLNPTSLGSAATAGYGTVDVWDSYIPLTGTVSNPTMYMLFEFGRNGAKPIELLAGGTEQLCLNFGGVSAAATLNIVAELIVG